MNDESNVKILDKADPLKQTSLEAEMIPDPMEGEQTWPTPEEMVAAEGQLKMRNNNGKEKMLKVEIYGS